ncbi:FprA family A-type flavoprotein [candidate division WOR-3 bacterium]|nr:FprA family A-type flavoprotein [candidate division WOR-3 bacterium]
MLRSVKITEKVHWVGAIDCSLRYFHGYTTNFGTTYNAYLILSDKITLIDTVKKGFEEEMLSRIESVVDPEKIDYIVSNHSEPDHSGALVWTVEKVKPVKVYASPNGVKALNKYYPSLEVSQIKDAEKIDIGGSSLDFFITPMLHWPDSMVSYLTPEKIVFSQDAFGMHLASSERFDDEMDWATLKSASAQYYANIITPYAKQVETALRKIGGLDISIVAPDHGPIWRDMERFKKIIKHYSDWASGKLERKAVIVYETMWKSTELMAKHLEDGLRSENINVSIIDLKTGKRSDVASELLGASALLAGSPTLNNNAFPSLFDALSYAKGLKFKIPFGVVFGSFGWSGEGTGQLKTLLESMSIEVLHEIKCLYIPDEEILERCFEAGKDLGKKINENSKGN